MTTPTPKSGMRLGPYTLGDVLGRGGGGWVFRAADDDGTQVALKLCADPKLTLRFEAEANVLGQFDHKRIVTVLDGGHEPPWFWYSMPLYPTTLSDHTRDAPAPPLQALEWCIQILEGLAVLHHADMVHRDIKPANVFLDAAGEVVVGDLGAARQPVGSVRWETRTGSHMGTLDYAAPEQGHDAKRVDRRADLFAVGATLFRLNTDRRPGMLFMAEDMPELIEPLDPALHAVVIRLCQNEPDDRPATAYDAAALLAQTADEIRAEAGEPPQAEARMAAFAELVPHEGWFLKMWRRFRHSIEGRT